MSQQREETGSSPFHDFFTQLLGVQASHRKLIDQAAISSGHRILEIGCGTGNLAILAKHLNSGADVVRMDPDPKALARAMYRCELALGMIILFTFRQISPLLTKRPPLFFLSLKWRYCHASSLFQKAMRTGDN